MCDITVPKPSRRRGLPAPRLVGIAFIVALFCVIVYFVCQSMIFGKAVRNAVNQTESAFRDWQRTPADSTTKKLMAIDLTGCPRSFDERFVAVQKAWENVSVNMRVRMGGEAQLRGLAGDPKLDAAIRKFNDARTHLFNCARWYGAGAQEW